MKTQKTELTISFDTISVLELNNIVLKDINGGTLTMVPYLTSITDLPNYSKNTLCTSDAK